jgi:hypothetical protein
MTNKLCAGHMCPCRYCASHSPLSLDRRAAGCAKPTGSIGALRRPNWSLRLRRGSLRSPPTSLATLANGLKADRRKPVAPSINAEMITIGTSSRDWRFCARLARALDGLNMQRVAHRFRCGVKIRAPRGCLTRTEACALLKIGAHRLRGLATKPRHVRHRMYDGPHCHPVTYVPVPLFKYLAWKLPYDGGPVHAGAIAEAQQADTPEARLFAMWALERNARCVARLTEEVGGRNAARELRELAAALREDRQCMIQAILEVVEERMPEYRR